MSTVLWPILSRTRLQLRLSLMVFLAMIALVTADTIGTWNTRQEIVAAARSDTTHLARSLSDDVSGVFRTMDTILIGLRERVAVDGTTPAALQRLNSFLKDRVAALPMLHSLLIVGADGHLLVSSADATPPGLDMSKSPTFQHHRDNADLGLFIGPPVRNIIDGHWVIKISRRVNHTDGSFAGVVVACVATAFFQDLVGTFDVGKHGVILLATRTGVAIARAPFLTDLPTRNLSSGPLFRQILPFGDHANFEGTSPLDGTLRLGSFHGVAGTPIVVVVALSKVALLAGWWKTVVVHVTGIGLVLALIYELGRRLALRIGERERSRELLQDAFSRLTQSERHLTAANHRLGMAEQIAEIGHWNIDLANGYALTWSAEVYDIHGVDPACFIPNLDNAIAAYHPDDRQHIAQAVNRTIETGEPFQTDLRLVRPDGTVRIVRSRGIRQCDSEGHELALFGVFIDVTDQKNAEEELLRAHAEAEAANQALAEANRALEAIALQDALTGLANRRRFDSALDHEFHHAARTSIPLALVLMDVDNFKSYNDIYGHPAGDLCLRTIAEAIAPFASRPGDVASRYGGEELALLLPACGEDDATLIAHRITRAIRDLALPHAGSATGIVTLSAGVAALVPTYGSDLPASLVSCADEALYAAKRGGRDRALAHSGARRNAKQRVLIEV